MNKATKIIKNGNDISLSDDIGDFNSSIQNQGLERLMQVREFHLKTLFNSPQFPRTFGQALPNGVDGSVFYDTTNNVLRVRMSGVWKTITAV